ncbi:MAG: hypothetical protein DRI95_02575 [Bacteroidetes bacterium]|nr:MAG: hypothetical protein DRI89_00050 [Bacteroidota bacterium]RLD68595.1 MAG: hypothetical protein DRI95_02575 [Bacteroidota bacterium]
MNQNKVYIITINFGTPGHTIECLESICVNNHKLFQVVVVDVSNINQSVKKITRWIDEKNDSRFAFIQEKENRGFAYANNIGIRYSLEQPDCDFIWVLNNDTVIAQNTLEELLNCYEQDKNKDKAGFYGSKILDYKDKELIQNVGGTFNKWIGYSVLLGMGEKDIGQFDKKEIKLDYVIGASMFCHSSLLQKIGLLSDDYFLYYEDIDWCVTAQKAGFQNRTCTRSRVFHKQGISTGAKLLENDVGLEYKKYLYSSYKKLYKRHFRMLMPVAYFILFKQLAGKIIHGSFAEAKLILKVLFTSR